MEETQCLLTDLRGRLALDVGPKSSASEGPITLVPEKASMQQLNRSATLGLTLHQMPRRINAHTYLLRLGFNHFLVHCIEPPTRMGRH